MGAELDRLMKLYGVGSATITPYTGTLKPTDEKDTNYAKQLAQYNIDRPIYDQYVQDYKNRIGSTGNMYNQPQFGMNTAMPEILKSPVFSNVVTSATPAATTTSGSTTSGSTTSGSTTSGSTTADTPSTATDYNYQPGEGSGGGGWAHGGYIKNYAVGGLNKLAADYDVPDITQEANPANLPNIMAQNTAGSTVNDAGLNPPAAAPQAPAPSMGGYSFGNVGGAGITAAIPSAAPAPSAPSAPAVPSSEAIKDLFDKYNTGKDYTGEIKAASEKAKAETGAFRDMLTRAMKGNEDNMPSKAEMYFRLAAALGAPTKTKQGFMENVAGAAGAMADYQKSVTEAKRANQSQNLQLALKGQELGMQSAKEELATLRNLQGEENKDKRLLATEMVKEYIRSGEPQSAAGKQAKDEGLKPGTPEYQKRVDQIAQTGVEAKTAEIAKKLSDMENAQARKELAERKQKEAEKSLTAPELKLKTETEDILAQNDQAMKDLKEAYRLNPKTFDTSLGDVAQRKILENTQSDNPKVVATREMENLLSKGAVNKLRAAFGGNPTEGERAILLSLEGIGAKSKEERALIMQNAFQALQANRERHQKRLEDITSGKYREKSTEGAQ
jgi:hypothetical protein